MSGGNHEMKVMKRIILALFFILAGFSVALCDDDFINNFYYYHEDFEYINRNAFGADWFLDKYYFVREKSDVLGCVLTVRLTSEFRNHLLYTLNMWFPQYDEKFRIAMQRASYLEFYQSVDTRLGYFYTTGVSVQAIGVKVKAIGDYKYKSLEFLEYKDIPNTPSTFLTSETKNKILTWIQTNRPVIYDDSYSATVASVRRHDREIELERMREGGQHTNAEQTAKQKLLEDEKSAYTISTTMIVVFILIGAVILSVSLGLFLEYLANRVIGPDNLIPPEQPTEKNAQESEVINAEFTDAPKSDDYEYPYEDISKVVGEKQ